MSLALRRRALMVNGTSVPEGGLLNGVAYNPGYFNASGGIAAAGASKEVYFNKIEVDTNTTYVIQIAYENASQCWAQYASYDENDAFVSRVAIVNDMAATIILDRVAQFVPTENTIAITISTYGDCLFGLFTLTDYQTAFDQNVQLPLRRITS